jgi:hypothetical protein
VCGADGRSPQRRALSFLAAGPGWHTQRPADLDVRGNLLRVAPCSRKLRSLLAGLLNAPRSAAGGGTLALVITHQAETIDAWSYGQLDAFKPPELPARAMGPRPLHA